MTFAIEAVSAVSDLTKLAGQPGSASTPRLDTPSFGNLLLNGVHSVDQKIADADNLVRQFTVDDSVTVHRVTIALEEARLSVELGMQVRARLVEAYRDLMTMQL